MDAANIFPNVATGPTEPTSRKRGRPPKQPGSLGTDNGTGKQDNGAGNETVGSGTEAGSGENQTSQQEPISPESATGGAEPKRRRGRPPKSATAAQPERLGLDAATLAPKIQGLHAMLAVLTKQPVFAISEVEAQMLAASLADVSKHYDISANSKTMSLVSLVAVAGMIYVPRVVALAPKPKVRSAVAPAMPENIVPTPQKGSYDFSSDVQH